MQPLNDGRYDSIIDFVTAATTLLRNPENKDGVEYWMKDHDDWYGADCKTGKDVMRKLRDGWTDGRKRCEAMLAKIDTSNLVPLDRRRRQIRSDMGDNLDMQAVYLGNLDTCWSVAKRKFSSGPQRIEILANMICSGGDKADVLFWRGAAAVALADKLEAAGYMVRIVVGFGGNLMGDERVSCRITVKDHGMPLDIATATSVVMPGFFRAIGHCWITTHCNGRNSGMGISVERGVIEPGELDLSHQVNNERTALAWIKEQIDALNAPMEDVA